MPTEALSDRKSRLPGSSMPLQRSLFLFVLGFFALAAPARAQYSQSLFLELVRDPGRADLPRTAKSLALGAIQSASGGADAALVSPGSLLLGNKTDLVLSIGQSFYARNELTNTPKQLPSFDPARTLSPRSSVPAGYAAIATRRSNWAVAAFYDATSRYAHAFTTARSNVFFTALFPTIIDENATGSASIAQSATRIGGTIDAGSRRAGVGASLYVIRLHYLATATDRIEIGSRSIANPTFTVVCCVEEQDRVEFRNWGAGITLSGVVTPIRHLTLTARWRHEPAFEAVRELSIRRQSPVEVRERVQLRLPGAYGFGAIVSAGTTTILGEVTRELYSGAFSPVMAPTFDPNYICATLRPASCQGWNFPYHQTKDTTTVKMAVEQKISGHLLLRGGIAREPGYTLARIATDPSTRRMLEFPAPPIATPFEPPREDLTWLSGGAAYAWKAVEVGFGLGHANHQTRWLVDCRIGGG